MTPKPTSGESARFHLSDYRLVARHNFQVAVTSPPRMPQRNTNLSVGPITMPPAVAPSFGTSAVAECRHQRRHRTSTVTRSNGMLIRRLAASSDSLRRDPPRRPTTTASASHNAAAQSGCSPSPLRLRSTATLCSGGRFGRKITSITTLSLIRPGVAGDLHHRSGHHPNRLAFFQNGSYLYVGADGLNAVERVNLASNTVD